MAVFKCKMCGGELDVAVGMAVIACEYCGTKQTIPRLSDDRRANLYGRANHFRRNNEFDKAMSIYEQILAEDSEDAETYWSLVLCRYGIDYVKDPATGNMIPTVNRAQFTSIFDDENYRLAIQHADIAQKSIYESEATAINKIQKEILAISQKEEPFDIFICYKETDANGARTPDSVLAQDLYYQLTGEGYKVFFSRITLEDKLGSAYEPYIFAALNSSKVMVVLGTKPEHFNATWVKNEWSRYLGLIKQGEKKILIPAYRDIDPYDLPDEFSHLQAQDMAKLGFMQDLIRGIKKMVNVEEPKPVAEKEAASGESKSKNIDVYLKRAFMALEDREFARADVFGEQILNIDPECAEAYLIKLLSANEVTKLDQLFMTEEKFWEDRNYQRTLIFASDDLCNVLKEHVYAFGKRNSNTKEGVTVARMRKAKEAFENIKGYKDSNERAEICSRKINDTLSKYEQEKSNKAKKGIFSKLFK